MQQKITDALQERLTSKMRLNEQQQKLETLIAENKTFLEKISTQEDEMRKLKK